MIDCNSILIGAGHGSVGGEVVKYFSGRKPFIIDIKPDPSVDLVLDATDRDFHSTLIRLFDFLKPSLIINFVGAFDSQKIQDLSVDNFERIWNINMLPMVQVAKALSKYPLDHRYYVKFIQIGSNSASYPFTGLFSYCTVKAAQKQAIKIMAKELAPYIHCNMINPGAFHPQTSNMSSQQLEVMFPDIERDEAMDRIISRIPLDRLCYVDDLISTIDFLYNNEYMTGQIIELSGGQILNG